MWIPDGVHGGLVRGARGRVAVVVWEEIPQVGFFGVEIQFEVDDGWVVGGGARVIVVEDWKIIKRTARVHGVARFFDWGRIVEDGIG